ncbi:MAG: response regulator transcription factor [Sulfurimonas sp.]|nr:response regulator transcription factor [Sulfurimonas sp.]
MIKFNILVIEDNSITTKALEYDLTNAGYRVLLAHSPDIALKYISKGTFDLMITDINLGDRNVNGIDLVKKLNLVKNIPVIYLTAHGDDETLEDVAETNHFYYMSKPYNSDSLLKIIKLAIIIYKNNLVEKIYLNQNITYDMSNRILYCEGKEIKLTIKENLFLTLLVERKNQVVSTYEIVEYVWNKEVVSQGSMRQLISRAREKFAPLTIETHHGEGYRLKVV